MGDIDGWRRTTDLLLFNESLFNERATKNNTKAIKMQKQETEIWWCSDEQ